MSFPLPCLLPARVYINVYIFLQTHIRLRWFQGSDSVVLSKETTDGKPWVFSWSLALRASTWVSWSTKTWKPAGWEAFAATKMFDVVSQPTLVWLTMTSRRDDGVTGMMVSWEITRNHREHWAHHLWDDHAQGLMFLEGLMPGNLGKPCRRP